jgi:hypothetical protein
MTVMFIFSLYCELQGSELICILHVLWKELQFHFTVSLNFPLAVVGVLFLYLIATIVLLFKNRKFYLAYTFILILDLGGADLLFLPLVFR